MGRWGVKQAKKQKQQQSRRELVLLQTCPNKSIVIKERGKSPHLYIITALVCMCKESMVGLYVFTFLSLASLLMNETTVILKWLRVSWDSFREH